MAEGRPASGPRQRSEGALYVVATVHLDTQWRWTIQETIRSYLPDTLRGNFELFEKHPHYVLSFEGAFRYMLIREYYPEAWERLKEYVRRGRWTVAGNMLDAADVNLVSPESLIRHMLYGGRFFERELGEAGRDVFLPDCFGFGWALPSVAAHCGLIGFSSQKFIKWIAPAAIPFDVGLWEGPDGATVLAALDPEAYGDGIDDDLSRAERWRRRIRAIGERTGAYMAYKYFGIGDRGGAPDEASIVRLGRALEDPGPLDIVHDRSDRFFADLGRQASAERLPRHRGELLLPVHGTGCYTALASMKRWNRKNELLADAAERAAAAAAWLGAAPYPADDLREAWIRFLWHQMHDDLTGTSIPQAYYFSWNDEAVATNRFATVLGDSVGALSRALDTAVEGVPLVVYNPLSVDREDVVEADVDFEDGAPEAVRVFDAEGREVISQASPSGDRRLRVVFVAALPAGSLAVFEVRPAASGCRLDAGLGVSETGVEGRRYRAAVNRRGEIASLHDARLDRELLAAPLRLQLLPDGSSRFPAWEMRYRDVHAPPRFVGRRLESRVIEAGPARVTLEVRRAHRRSRFVDRIRLAAGGAGERLEIDSRMEWRTWGRMLKLELPLAVPEPRATYDLGLGAIERGVNRPESYEVPAQQWADLSAGDSSDDGGFGVSVLNDCKYGWDRPAAGTLRMTVTRSPWAARGHPHQATQDWGSHRYLWALYGHRGGWADGDTVWQAARLNQPLLAFQAPRRAGGRRTLRLFASSDRQAAIRALKEAEAGGEWILRLQETGGEARPRVRIELAAPIAAAREVDGGERPRGEATVEDGALTTSLGAFAPRSFALRLAAATEPLEPPRWRALELPRDTPAASFHGGGAVDFDGRGRSLPGELLPTRVVAAGIELHLAPLEPGAPHCVACRGQEIELPEGRWERLYLLAAAVGGDLEATFTVGGESRPLRIAEWTGRLGEASHRPAIGRVRYGRARPGFLKRDALAWVGTHRHDDAGDDEPYVFCYLFRYALPLPAAVSAASAAPRLRLPEAPRVRLFAATVARDVNDLVRPAQPLFEPV